MNKLLTLTASMLIMFVTSNIANAGSINIGVQAGVASLNASGKETSSVNTGAESSVTTASVENAAIPIAAIFAEYESDFYGLTLGVSHIPMTADVRDSVKRRTDVETSVTGDTTANTGARLFQANAEVENFNSVYVELPVTGGFFVRAGLAQIDVNTKEVASSNGGSYGNKTLDGQSLGAGLKGDFANGMGYKLFYEKTDFDTLKLTSSGNSVAGETNSLTADLDVTELKFALSYKF
jgi:hypothetical protein